jgi:hypothetical protein
MNSSEKEKTIFRDLLIKSMDGQIIPEEAEQFNALLAAYPDLEDYYVKCVQLQSALREIRIVNDLNLSDLPDYKDQALWNALANAEKESPAVAIPPVAEIPVENIQPQKEIRKISKGSLFTLCATAAAIIFIFVFVHVVPPAAGIEVAVLSDSIHAKWSDSTGAIPPGSRLVTGYTPLVLQEGIVELRFDNAAKVVIEAPAQFCLLTADQMKLNYGKLYAVVPQSAIGFCVNTSNARVIDLGTEFGVQAVSNGSTELHVIKGKINLLAGTTNKKTTEIGQGFAKLISGTLSQVHDIPVNETEFVRSINSNNDTVWRGQKQINLADIVGGGNGLGTGKIDMGIDPISGKFSKESWGTRTAANAYHPVPANPYVDGVFVPNGRTPQIVSSQGHRFDQCPVTSGLSCERIGSSPVRSLDSRIVQNTEITDSLAHSLLVHSNMGITFDLQAIRNYLPGVKIARFQSKFGIRQWAIHPTASNADFWVLVDGKLRYTKQQVKINEPYSVDIELLEQDRFLTLIETDGGDPEGRTLDGLVLPPNDSDWGVFADPVLVLK